MALIILADSTHAKALRYDKIDVSDIEKLVRFRSRAHGIAMREAFRTPNAVIVIEGSAERVRQALTKITLLDPDKFIRAFIRSAQRLGIPHLTIKDLKHMADTESRQAIRLAHTLGFSE